MKYFSSSQLSASLGTRAPMLMLDLAQISDNGDSAVARKAVSMNEAVFQGHFPGQPILPGVLQVAAMTQLAKMLFKEAIPGLGGTEIVLKKIHRLKFRKPVLPGMVMTIEAKIQERHAEGEVDFLVTCNTEQGMASTGVVTLARVNPKDYDTPRVVVDRPDHPFVAEMAGCPETDVTGLMKLLPHRQPFLLIDKAVNIGVPEKRIFGYKNLTGNDMMLAGGHNDVYPFPLMIEAAAQLGCAHILSQPDNAGKLGIFLCIDSAEFFQHAMIGDQLLIVGQCDTGSRAGTASAELWVNDQKIAELALKFILLDSLK